MGQDLIPLLRVVAAGCPRDFLCAAAAGVVVGIVVGVLVDMGGDYCRASEMLGDGDDEHVGIPAYLRLLFRSVK